MRQELETDRYPRTRINNRLTFPESMLTRDKWVGVLGEHYLPDSELFHRTTFPEVPDRLLPSGLDVAVALGSETAAARLAETAAAFPQVTPKARAFGQTMELSGVYGQWLGTLKTLFDKPAGLPRFARGDGRRGGGRRNSGVVDGIGPSDGLGNGVGRGAVVGARASRLVLGCANQRQNREGALRAGGHGRSLTPCPLSLRERG